MLIITTKLDNHNIVPNIICDLYNNCQINNYKNALNIYKKLNKLIELLFIESNPSPCKFILKSMKSRFGMYL